MKTRSVYFASAGFIRAGREARNAVGNTKATLQKEPMVTLVTLVPVATLQACLRAGCALSICVICKVPLATFLDTLGFQQEIWLFTASALMGTLALDTVVAAAFAEAQVSVEGW